MSKVIYSCPFCKREVTPNQEICECGAEFALSEDFNKVREKAIKRLEKEFKHGCDPDDANYYWQESFYWFTRAIELTIRESLKQFTYTKNERKPLPQKVCFCCKAAIEQEQQLCDYCASQGHCKENGFPTHEQQN